MEMKSESNNGRILYHKKLDKGALQVLTFIGIFLLSIAFYSKTGNRFIYYIRYLFVLYMMFLTLKSGWIIKNKMFFMIVGLMMAHTMIFGFLIVPDTLRTQIRDNGIAMCIFWLAIILTTQYVYKNGLEKHFLMCAQIFVSLFMNYCYITNFNGIAPIKFLPGLFGKAVRIRFTFGLSATNRAAYLAMASLVLSMIVWRVCLGKKSIINKKWTLYEIYILISGMISILVIISTQTRGAVLASVVFYVISRLLCSESIFYRSWRKKTKYYILLCSVFIIVVYIYYVFIAGDNRSHFLQMNFDIFKSYANQLIGLGYVPFSGFLSDIFGYGTKPMDGFYVYIICSTGYIGALMIFLPLLMITIQYLKRIRLGQVDLMQKHIIALWICMLFVSATETNLINPSGVYSYIYWVLFLGFFFNRNELHY